MIHHFTLKSIYIPDLDINIPISPWHQHVHTWPTLWYTYVTLSLIYIADLEINIQIWPWHQYTYLIFNLHFHFNINIHTLPWHQYTNPTLTSTYIHDLDINIQTWPWHQYTTDLDINKMFHYIDINIHTWSKCLYRSNPSCWVSGPVLPHKYKSCPRRYRDTGNECLGSHLCQYNKSNPYLYKFT